MNKAHNADVIVKDDEVDNVADKEEEVLDSDDDSDPDPADQNFDRDDYPPGEPHPQEPHEGDVDPARQDHDHVDHLYPPDLGDQSLSRDDHYPPGEPHPPEPHDGHVDHLHPPALDEGTADLAGLNHDPHPPDLARRDHDHDEYKPQVKHYRGGGYPGDEYKSVLATAPPKHRVQLTLKNDDSEYTDQELWEMERQRNEDYEAIYYDDYEYDDEDYDDVVYDDEV